MTRRYRATAFSRNIPEEGDESTDYRVSDGSSFVRISARQRLPVSKTESLQLQGDASKTLFHQLEVQSDAHTVYEYHALI
jgi:hypothetical protein